jgi:hypothetical protein
MFHLRQENTGAAFGQLAAHSLSGEDPEKLEQLIAYGYMSVTR